MKSRLKNMGIGILWIVMLAILGVGIFLVIKDKKVVVSEQPPVTVVETVLHAQDQCGLVVSSPLPMSAVNQSFSVGGTFDMNPDLDCRWIVFEGQAGRIEVRNPVTGDLIVPIIPLSLPSTWMDTAIAGGVISFSVPIVLPATYTGSASILLIEDDPSGEAPVINTLMLAVTVQ